MLRSHHGVQVFGKKADIVEESFTPNFLIFLIFCFPQRGNFSVPAFFLPSVEFPGLGNYVLFFILFFKKKRKIRKTSFSIVTALSRGIG